MTGPPGLPGDKGIKGGKLTKHPKYQTLHNKQSVCKLEKVN